MKPTFGSLFSGIGGIDIGLERAGAVPVWQAEKDPACRRILARHWPSIKAFDDVQAICESTPRADIICGGFPCQDLSVAGKRAGLAGKRSGLFFEFVRILGALTPRWVFIENVPGLLSSNHGRDMGTVLWNLGQLGYGWSYRVLDAQYLGVPQRRRRVFIVGCLGDGARAASVLFEPQSCNGDSSPCREMGSRIAATLRSRAKNPGVNEAGRGGEDDQNLILPGREGTAFTLKGTHRGVEQGHNGNFVAHTLSAEGCDAPEDGTGRGTPLIAVRSSGHCGSNGIGVYQHGDAPTLNTCGDLAALVPLDMRQASRGATMTNNRKRGSGGAPGTGIGKAGDPSPSISTSHPPAIAGACVRRLTPRECERLQGFPDDWTVGEKDTTRYRMIGNAVCVPVALWIGQRLVQANQE